MAIVTILLSCAIGAIAGVFQLTFLGASVGQAFLTYLSVSLILSAAAIGGVVVVGLVRSPHAGKGALKTDDMDSWQDWRTQEQMDTDRLLCAADRSNGGPAKAARSELCTALDAPLLAEATAYTVQRAGKG